MGTCNLWNFSSDANVNLALSFKPFINYVFQEVVSLLYVDTTHNLVPISVNKSS